MFASYFVVFALQIKFAGVINVILAANAGFIDFLDLEMEKLPFSS